MFVTDEGLTSGTGAQRFALRLCKLARSHGFEAFFLQTSYVDRSRLTSEQIDEAVPPKNILTVEDHTHRLDWVATFPLGRLLLYGALAPAARSIQRINRRIEAQVSGRYFDIVYLTSNPMASGFRTSHSVVVGSSHGGMQSETEMALVRAHLLYPRIDAFHVLSQGVLEKLKGHRLAFVVPPAVDLTAFAPPEGAALRTTDFLFVGRLLESKGIREILEAWSRLDKRTPVRLTVVGSGKLEGLVTSRIRPETRDRLVLLPKVTEPELVRLFQTSRTVIVPSRQDAFPAVVLEAISCGCRVIASDVLKGTFDPFEQAGVLEYCVPEAAALHDAMAKDMRQPSTRPAGHSSRSLMAAYELNNVAARFFASLDSLLKQ